MRLYSDQVRRGGDNTPQPALHLISLNQCLFSWLGPAEGMFVSSAEKTDPEIKP